MGWSSHFHAAHFVSWLPLNSKMYKVSKTVEENENEETQKVKVR